MASLSSPSHIVPKSGNTRELRKCAFKVPNHKSCPEEYRIPGYLVNPKHLVELLREKFNNNYKVKLRNDNYLISTPERLTQNDLIRCY
ncbi:hypothetical protein F4813DRAFT_369198 [Daldinia decipiens]|uniref:uncharacterized protein n=1 Tax=Daldinia decipiens TaxID=326647 RepID=UPI0020C41B7B|nr:uncharacterized protein F4813DRAFT_369198 [Daldinia decipiens]KAI1654741.1 hypothetical protein F4813DRAFT_369198 [Daldinia decipiens]